MTEQQSMAADGPLAELREHARRLAGDLAGPLRRVSVHCGDAAVEVEWQPQAGPAAIPGPPGGAGPPGSLPQPERAHDAAEPGAASPPGGGTAEDAPRPAADGEAVISSPMVGTFYRAPSPGAPPFVEAGDTVEPGQTVAIVEAMKLFNPITAESAGVVSEVLAEDGKPVEFDEPLLRLTPASPAAGPTAPASPAPASPAAGSPAAHAAGNAKAHRKE